MTKKEVEARRKRMRAVVARFQKYVSTYSEQSHYEDYSDRIFLDDMLYGIGLALSEGTAKDNSGAGGYERFKVELRRHLNGEGV